MRLKLIVRYTVSIRAFRMPILSLMLIVSANSIQKLNSAWPHSFERVYRGTRGTKMGVVILRFWFREK